MNQEQTNITTGKQIRHLRTQLGMTQEELAGELNVTRQALSNWERDVNEPDLNMLKKICFLFGVNMDDFAKEVITKMETYEKKEKRQFNKYAKDTSKKIRAVMKVKGNAGEHLTTLPPYGYMKAPDNKKLWVRDEEAATVVYEIGLYVMDGFGPSQIARKLTERRILTPAAYYASKGRKASNIKRGLPYAWDASTVADIMDRWREYLGHTVNFKTRKKSYKSKKVIHNPESEWMIFENTHDPIWTEAIADADAPSSYKNGRNGDVLRHDVLRGLRICHVSMQSHQLPTRAGILPMRRLPKEP